ncbi:hypothetical protein D3C84_675110 [compost metagenome]
MGIAPRRQGWFLPHVLIPHVVPAHEAEHAVDHHNLAVITEVDLEAIEPAAAGGEGFDLDTAVAQRLYIAVGQGVAADSIVEQVNRDAFGGFFQQQFVQALTEAIVVKDKKLNQHGFFCLVDGIENRIEGCPAVN